MNTGKTIFKNGHIPWNKGKKGIQSGENHPMWKGGIRLNGRGYVYIWTPTHPYATKQKYVREHRLVMEKYLGRYLKRDEVVHHINGDKKDNRIENLIIFKNSSEHIKFEWKMGSYL